MTVTAFPLRGNKLISFIEDLQEQGYKHQDIAPMAGYVYPWGKVKWTEYYEELMIAKGMVNRWEVQYHGMSSHVIMATDATPGLVTRRVKKQLGLTGVRCTRIRLNDVTFLYPQDNPNEYVMFWIANK